MSNFVQPHHLIRPIIIDCAVIKVHTSVASRLGLGRLAGPAIQGRQGTKDEDRSGERGVCLSDSVFTD